MGMDFSDVPKSRIAYCLIFTIHIIITWVSRDVISGYMRAMFASAPLVLSRFNCTTPDCYGDQLVSRFGLTFFLWHLTLSLIFAPRNKHGEAYPWQAYFHYSAWWLKLPALVIAHTVVILFFPHNFFEYYFYIESAGAGIFLVIQAVFVVDLSYWWSESWSDPPPDAVPLPWDCLTHVTTLVFFLLSIGVLVFLSIYYTIPAVCCWANIFLLAETAFLCLTVSAISSHPEIERGNLFISSIICFYVVLVIASAISGQTGSICNQLQDQSYDFLTAAGALSALFFVVYGALFYFVPQRTLAFKLEKRRPYDFTKFHLLFAFGSMYIGMVFTDWSKGGPEIGPFPFWIKFAAQTITLVLYGWALVAPLVIKLVFGDGEADKLIQVY